MKVARPFRFPGLLTMLLLVAITDSIQPSDVSENTEWGIVRELCGDIAEDTIADGPFYVTCDVSVQSGVTLIMMGTGIMDRYVAIDVYGELILWAQLDWNVSSPPPDPYDAIWYGITIHPSGRVSASGFEIQHALFGIRVLSDMNTISGGNILNLEGMFSSEGIAIDLYGDNNTVDNMWFDNVYVGVEIPEDADGNVIEKSRFSSSSYGMKIGGRFGGAHDNTIVCNDFLDNHENIHVLSSGSSGNIIHHNNFYKAEWTLVFDEVTNIWDDGYPNGGNYWSDYTGNDTHRGPNQDFPGSDGIGDEPYKVPSWALDLFDSYPFKNPVPLTNCPAPPPQMPPGKLPPYNLFARLDGPSFSDVNISWNLSWDDGNPGFRNYAIYYSESYRTDKSGYEFLAEVSAGTGFYVHSGAGHGDPSNYFYYVQANDTSGFPGKSYHQVAKFTKSLQKGPNLVSIPLLMDDMSAQAIAQTTKTEWARRFNSTTGQWEEYHSQKGYGNFGDLTLQQAIWLHVSEDCQLTIAGRVPLAIEVDLIPGWNLVSYPSFTGREVSVALSGVPYTVVEGFDPASSPYHLKSLSANDTMVVGEGYWIKVNSPCKWTLVN